MLSLGPVRRSQSFVGEIVVGRAGAGWRRRAPSVPGRHGEHRPSPARWSRLCPSPRSSVGDSSLMGSLDACPHSLGVRGSLGHWQQWALGYPLGPLSVLWRESHVRHPPHDPGVSEAQRSCDLVRSPLGRTAQGGALARSSDPHSPRWGPVDVLLGRVISGGSSQVLSSVGLQGRGVVFFSGGWEALSAALVQGPCRSRCGPWVRVLVSHCSWKS